MGQLPASQSSVCWCRCCWKEGLEPPVSQLGELNQEIPAGPAGSRLSHFAALSKCPCRGCRAGGQGLPAHVPAVPLALASGHSQPCQPRASVSPQRFPRTG